MSDAATTAAFDYTVIEAATAATLRAAVAAIRTIQRSAIADVGNHLITAKELLEHGEFSRWAAGELRMTVRSAERYMQAARFLAGKATRVSLLPAALIYKLAAPSAPSEIVARVIAQADRGEALDVRRIRYDLASATKAARAAEIEATKSEEQKKKERKARESRVERASRLEAEREAEERQQQERQDNLVLGFRPATDAIAKALDRSDLAKLVADITSDYRHRDAFLIALKESHIAGAPLPPTDWHDVRDRALLKRHWLTSVQQQFLAGLGERHEPSPEQLAKLHHIAQRAAGGAASSSGPSGRCAKAH